MFLGPLVSLKKFSTEANGVSGMASIHQPSSSLQATSKSLGTVHRYRYSSAWPSDNSTTPTSTMEQVDCLRMAAELALIKSSLAFVPRAGPSATGHHFADGLIDPVP